ncbi:hypothetical protein [Neosynechococcus sphagnicola]|uniref:hypothetical protein n=1 Tax=Neosynechococcus sphagnicola TaxID=1501145 RepID=UPI001EF9D6C8|nr:hypothetical protein [Neosynechococcus sphagnicola]
MHRSSMSQSDILDATVVLQGLTQDQVTQQRAAGLGNDVRLQTSRPYRQILKENIFTFINAAFF